MSCRTSHAASAPVRDGAVTVKLAAPLATIDDRFLSFAVDAAQVVGATFWSPDAGMRLNGSKSLVTVALLPVTALLLIVKVPPAIPRVSVLNAIPAASASTPCGDTAV